MLTFHIRVVHGDEKEETMYWFVHKEWKTKPEDEQAEDWHNAVKELNHIYEDYGRFATQVGITRFFDKHGFERTIL